MPQKGILGVGSAHVAVEAGNSGGGWVADRSASGGRGAYITPEMMGCK
ncbi:MAG: hypothetical protein U9N61_10595 [Euryarchaeota archaeon]|nr:hypothetical protein [Euryarchaeota archaeon]